MKKALRKFSAGALTVLLFLGAGSVPAIGAEEPVKVTIPPFAMKTDKDLDNDAKPDPVAAPLPADDRAKPTGESYFHIRAPWRACTEEYLPETGAAPEGGTANAPPATSYGCQQVVYDFKYFIRRPFHLDREDALWLGGTAAVTGFLYVNRENIRNEVQENKNDSFTDITDAVRGVMAAGAFAPGLALASFGASFITKNDREKETALLLLESAVLSQGVTFLGQCLFSSQRPPDTSVHLFSTGHSVSGDAALAASVVPPLRRQYFRVGSKDRLETRLWKWTGAGVLYAGAALAAFARVNGDRHWAPDAFLGMMAGLAVGEILCESHDRAQREREGAHERRRVTIGAMPGGLVVNVVFP